LNEKIYECKRCGKIKKVSNEKHPICCNKSMEKIKIEICTQAAHPENARPMDKEDVCDDGRAG